MKATEARTSVQHRGTDIWSIHESVVLSCSGNRVWSITAESINAFSPVDLIPIRELSAVFLSLSPKALGKNEQEDHRLQPIVVLAWKRSSFSAHLSYCVSGFMRTLTLFPSLIQCKK
ncbi:hypothetical protein E2C01_042330 [Portunus trituberculatus]|uniref:Uncharacterized protein n=1 Tax=Portunus trituberculatus TaxID=210409 RepID=A0A5B7FW61_PORTR|nr:hypothetical protein [Portunus trituberculatus]